MSEHTVTIYVDTDAHEVPKGDITYSTVVRFAYPDFEQTGATYSVKYTRGHGEKPDGILPPGGSVKVKEGMRFVISRTGES
jgi:hypothetical protein